jgi:hypothetical protein
MCEAKNVVKNIEESNGTSASKTKHRGGDCKQGQKYSVILDHDPTIIVDG